MAEVDLLFHPSLEISGTKYRVLQYDVAEGISTVPVVSLEFMLDDQEPPDPRELLGKEGLFSIERVDGSQKREWKGFLSMAARVPDDDDVRTMRAELVPRLWKAGKRADCRIFQKMTAKDIVTKVLEGAGVPAGSQVWALEGSLPERVYTVQYRETDLDFVQRLLSEEGVYFSVVTEDGEDKMHLCDHPTGVGDVDGKTTLAFRHAMGWQQGADIVSRALQRHEVKSDKVMLRDYNPEKPKLQLETTEEGTDDGSHALEVYEYPGRFADTGAGKQYAKVLVEELQAERDLVRGEASAIHLVPGYRFTLEEHPYEPLNQEYLILRATIRGATPRLGAKTKQDARYQLDFEGVPTKTTKYRPPRRRRHASVPGAQTAITSGPAGEEIHTDAGGHVKVQYHWDRQGKNDENTTLWMRTSQLPTGGSMLLPRMKWEVELRHREGDPDLPFVMARMYNTETPPPYSLPKDKGRSSLQTATTPGGGSSNEFRMSDGKGSEEMMFNASKDMSLDVKNNATEHVGNDATHKIGSNHTKSVTNSSTTTVAGDQKLTVTGKQKVAVETLKTTDIAGDHTLTIAGKRDMKIGGDHKRDVAGDSKFEISGRYIDLVVGNLTDATDANMTHDVGAVFVELTAADLMKKVGGNMNESVGAAKVLAVKGGVGVEVGGSMTTKVAGAIINMANGDKAVKSGGTYTEVAAGAQLVKCTNAVFEASGMIAVVMGASTMIVLPALVAVAGISIKLDGDVTDLGIVIDN